MKTGIVKSKLPGIISKIMVTKGQSFDFGAELLIIESMKMENVVVADLPGKVLSIEVEEGQEINLGDTLVQFVQVDFNGEDERHNTDPVKEETKSSRIEELRERKFLLTDEAREEQVVKRRKKEQNTARQNLSLLFDEGIYKEYGGLIVAAQRSRRSESDLIKNTPADGLITAIGDINSRYFQQKTQCLAMAYDYTVLAGTQGSMNHQKMDRMIAIAKKKKLPVVLFAEGGGGRPGDVDVQTIAGLQVPTFVEYASLRGKIPTIAIVNGYCFAGNAALAGSSDIIIATKNSSIGMGGPAMIEGGGLGKYHPSEVGTSDIQCANGVIDILANDESEAILTAQRVLGYWQGRIPDWEAHDQEELQTIIPENRRRTFDIRGVIQLILDKDSFCELGEKYAKGMITAFGRIEGRPIGVISNDSAFDAGAITAENAKKASSFIDLCHTYKIPILSLIDTPGIMVGPEAEKQGTVRAAGDLFVAGAKFQPTFLAVVLRRAYGLGAMAMMGGSTRVSEFTVSWPTGEFGAMGLEGAVRLGYRKELEKIPDSEEREKKFNKMVEEAYLRGRAMNMATMMEIDDVIEPKETRSWISMALKQHNL